MVTMPVYMSNCKSGSCIVQRETDLKEQPRIAGLGIRRLVQTWRSITVVLLATCHLFYNFKLSLIFHGAVWGVDPIKLVSMGLVVKQLHSS
ncbi:hypothetical protein WG66_010971 [Moniliophthora roreri]|nr:hypothetical protein WG66_010971 [Moniliophthora roreri]